MTDWRLTLRSGEGEGEGEIAAGGERSTTVTGAGGNARRTTSSPATLAIPTNAVADPAHIIPPAPIQRTKSLAESDDCAFSTTATTTATTPRASIASLSMSDSGGNLSNLDRFLEHPTLLVPGQQFSKTKWQKRRTEREVPSRRSFELSPSITKIP